MSDEMIPRSQFDAVNAQLAALRKEMEGNRFKVETFDKQVEKYNALEAEFKRARVDYATDLSLVKAGITDDGLSRYIRYQYSQAAPGEDGAPPAFGEWFEGFKTSNASLLKAAGVNLETAPAGAPPAAAPPVAPPAGAPPAPPAAPPATPGAKPPVVDASGRNVLTPAATPGGALTPKEIASLTPEQVKTLAPQLIGSLRN